MATALLKHVHVDVDRLTTFKFNATEMVSIVIDSATDGFPEMRARHFVNEHWYFFVQMCILYFFAIFSIKLFMRNREPFNLQRPLNMWNAFLAVFSIAGTVCMSHDFFGVLYYKGFRGSYCDRWGMLEGQNGLWTYLFMMSKLFEFVDTFFIVLRKKPLMFLHWYHHILTLGYGVFSYPDSPAFNRWGIYLNFAVHSIMYSYYMLRSMNVKIPGTIAKSITTLQILQFVQSIVVLSCIAFERYVLKWSHDDCELGNPKSYWFAVIMDVTYLILFLNFFLQSYVFKGGKDKYKVKDEKKKQ